MEIKSVKDVMVPRDQYAVVSQEDTLLEAIIAVEEAQKRRDRRRQPFRAVLVADENNNIVGKLGQLAFLKALQPQHSILSDTSKLASAGVSQQIMSSVLDHYQFFQDNMPDLCIRAAKQKMKDVMRPVSESIDEGVSLAEAISKIIESECQSILVTRETEVVGLLRLSDLCQEVAEYIKNFSSR